MSKSNILTSLKCFFILSSFLGIPFGVELKKGKIKISWVSILYSLFVAYTLFYILWIALHLPRYYGDLYSEIWRTLLICESYLILIMFAYQILRYPKLIRIVENLDCFGKLASRSGIFISFESENVKLSMSAIIFFAVAIATKAASFFIDTQLNPIVVEASTNFFKISYEMRFTIRTYHLFLVLSQIGMFCMLCWLIKVRFEHLNKFLLYNLNLGKTIRNRKLKQIIEMHNILCETIRLMNRYFELILITMLLRIIMNDVSIIHLLVNRIFRMPDIENFWGDVSANLCHFLMSLIMKVSICHSGALIVEAAEKCEKVISKFMNHSLGGADIELINIHYIISSRNIAVENRFFTINWKLFLTVS